jgi:hypothetical protein
VHRLGYINDDLAGELEKEINGVGAPLAGLVRSTKADVALSVLSFLVAVGAAVWVAA